MSNLLSFMIETSEAGLSREEFFAAIENSDLTEAEQAVVRSGDINAISDLLGTQPKIVCCIVQPEPDEDEEQEEDETKKAANA
ncbi:hypothetical protein [Echinimonas agarilytica]|uniref:Uncharacterized protein n=1 Tax=Echinimonas agarilytica TaxID=1215918 RepID=A0AA42B8A6_9GAMM|nr:hypothetical protein [Echinimonas agarilytica]MCM2680995.1 hypothetical protein [Echinimonas agarilytica]